MGSGDGTGRSAGTVVKPKTVQLTEVVALTEQVHQAITAGDWRAATELEASRRELLVLCLEQQRGPGLQHLASELSALQNTNNQIIGEVFHHRRRLEREAATVSTGRRALRAYGDQQRSSDRTE